MDQREHIDPDRLAEAVSKIESAGYSAEQLKEALRRAEADLNGAEGDDLAERRLLVEALKMVLRDR